MKNTMHSLALVSIVALFVVVASCASSTAQRDALAVTRAAVADGQVDDAEVVAIQRAVGQADDAGGGFDWWALGKGALAVGGALLGIRLTPNKLLLGSKAASKLV